MHLVENYVALLTDQWNVNMRNQMSQSLPLLVTRVFIPDLFSVHLWVCTTLNGGFLTAEYCRMLDMHRTQSP